MPRIRVHGSFYYAFQKRKKKRPREEEKQDWYCSIVVYRIAILLRELKWRISIEASLFHTLKQTRVHNIVNIYCEHNIASGLCHSRTIPNRDMRFRTIWRNDGFFITRASLRFLINTIRGRNATGRGATLSTRARACEICIEFRPLKSASLISVRTSDAYKNVPRAYDKRLTRSFIRTGITDRRGVRI